MANTVKVLYPQSIQLLFCHWQNTFLAGAMHTMCSLSRRFDVDSTQNICRSYCTKPFVQCFYLMRYVFLHDAKFGTLATYRA